MTAGMARIFGDHGLLTEQLPNSVSLLKIKLMVKQKFSPEKLQMILRFDEQFGFKRIICLSAMLI